MRLLKFWNFRGGPSRKVLALAAVPVSLLMASPALAADSLLTWDDIETLKIYHAYAASDGRTYIEEISVPAQNKGVGKDRAQLYLDIKPQAIRIARSISGSAIDWHYAGESVHLIIPMQGDTFFDTGNGTIFHLKQGEAILAEDWTGKGHRSGCMATNGKFCVVIDILVGPNPRALPLPPPPVK